MDDNLEQCQELAEQARAAGFEGILAPSGALDGESTRVANELADAASPYLRQHAENPVNWRVWSQEAFEEARRRDVPVFSPSGTPRATGDSVSRHGP